MGDRFSGVTIDRGPYQWPLQSPHVPRRGGHHRAGGHAMESPWLAMVIES